MRLEVTSPVVYTLFSGPLSLVSLLHSGTTSTEEQ